MSYEIPQSLQHKEKIVFNLTLEQMLYALVFGSIALIFIKLPVNLVVRIAVPVVLVCLAGMFMFFGLMEKIFDVLSWLRFRGATRGQSAMKKYLDIQGIENDCYLIKKKRIAVFAVEPINYKIKVKEEKESINYAFQKLLNSLEFPIQFLMYTDDLNLNHYIADLEAKVKNSFKLIFSGHKKQLQAIMGDKLSVNRKFYIVIKEDAVGFDAQINVVTEMLKSMGLRFSRLKGGQLARLLMKFFNNQPAKSLYSTIAPKEIKNFPDHIKVNEFYHRVISAVGYPRTVEEGFLDKIITTVGNFDLSIHVEPFPLDQTMVMLNKELQKQRADLYSAELKQRFVPSLEIQYKDTRAVLDSIQKGQEKLFNVSLYIDVKAKDLKELDLLTKSIQSMLNSILIIPKISKYRMAKGLKSILPFGQNELKIKRNITTFPLSAFYPFTSPFLMLEKGGVFLGMNKNKLPIIKDVFSLTNANGTILATSGSGKSYTAKLIISRYLMSGTKVIVIDPQSEYTKLTKEFGGTVITLSRNSETMINPLDLLGHHYVDKRLALMDMFKVMFGELSEVQKAILDQAIGKTYLKKGISEKRYADKIPPTLKDLFSTLESMSNQASVYERTTYIALITRLRMYVDGVYSFLNCQTYINFDNDFVTFNIGNLPKQAKPLMMFLILEYVYTSMKRDKNRKLLVIDEAWSMLNNADEEGFIFEVVKTCRKFNLGLLMITQDVADLLNARAGRAVLANSSYTFLFRQKPVVIDSIQDVFQLSFAERQHLLTANIGEGLLLMENDHQEIRITASNEEHKLITTKPEELIDAPELSVPKRKMIIELDLKKGYYKKSVLQPEEIDYLLKNKYNESKHVPLRSTTHSIYLVKKIGWHSNEHTFLVYAIYHEILKYTKEVLIDQNARADSINPDIVFKNLKGEQIALEIETGSNLKHHPEYMEKKVQRLNENYPDRWRFVLTSANSRRKYEYTFKQPVLLRHNIPAFIRWHFSKRQTHNNVPDFRLSRFTDDKKEDKTRNSNMTSGIDRAKNTPGAA